MDPGVDTGASRIPIDYLLTHVRVCEVQTPPRVRSARRDAAYSDRNSTTRGTTDDSALGTRVNAQRSPLARSEGVARQTSGLLDSVRNVVIAVTAGAQQASLGRRLCRPGAGYGASVARFVIDAPTLLHIVANDIHVNSRHQIVAPNLIRSQALTLLLQAVRRGDLTEKLALQHHQRLTELKMRLLGDRVSRRAAWGIAVEQGWDTTYEAEYLAVTKLQADALVTVDSAMATKAEGIVPLGSLAALSTDHD